MRKSDVLTYFGNGTKTAKALGVTKSAVSQWEDEEIPEVMAYRAQSASRGKLKVDPSVYQKPKKDSIAAA